MRPPPSLLARIRWLFALAYLLAVISELLLLRWHAPPSWYLRVATGVGLVWLAGRTIVEYRRQRSVPPLGDVLDGLILWLLGFGDVAPHFLGLLYIGLFCRPLYTSRSRLPLLVAIYLAVYLRAVVFGSHLSVTYLRVESETPFLIIIPCLAYFLAQALAQFERGRQHEHVLRMAGATLVQQRDRESIYAIAVDVGLSLIPKVPHGRVVLAVGSRETMTIVASRGDVGAEADGRQIGVAELPDAVRAALRAGQPIEAPATADITPLLFASSSASQMVYIAPLLIRRELAGILVLSGDSHMTSDYRDALHGLSNLVALALESCAVAEQRVWLAGEHRFRALVQNASDIVLILDQVGNISYISPSVQRLMGYTPVQLQGTACFSFVHPDDVASIISLFGALVQLQKALPPVTLRVRHADGSWRDVEMLGSNLLADPAVDGIVINLRDITERKRTEEARRVSEAGLAEAQRIAHLGNFSRNLDTGEVTFSDELYRIHGYEPGEVNLTTSGLLALVHPEDVARVKDWMTVALAGRQSSVDHRIIRPNGDVRWVQHRVEPTVDADGSLKRLAGTLHDITERKLTEEALGASEARFRSLVQHASDVITVIAVDGTILYESPSLMRILGFQPAERPGQSIMDLLHPDDIPAMRALGQHLQQSPGEQIALELRLRRYDGSWRNIEGLGTNLLVDPAVGGILINARDVTERKRAEEQLIQLAYADLLTGLPNRRLFMDHLVHALDGPVPPTVLFMDLDNFKVINDSLGHDVGDALLVEVAARLQPTRASGHMVARLGGDEFTILLCDSDGQQTAVALAKQLNTRFAAPFMLSDHELFVSTSIGIAVAEARQQPTDVMRNADIALYYAKQSGKGTYQLFEQHMNERALERLTLEGELRGALTRAEFEVYYQPQVDLASGQITGFEALVRWQHPQRGMVVPATFIPLAEETGLIYQLGQWVLVEACSQARRWHDRYPERPPVMMCVNLSAREFAQAQLVEQVAQTLRTTGLDPHNLQLEITETTVMDDAVTTSTTLGALKQLGVQLAIDDFGTGYSSLSYLKRFPLDTLKIDKSFVDGLASDSEDMAIVRALIGLGDGLGLTVIAEGVETDAQARLLQQAGCRLGQGYFFARPQPAFAIDALLLHDSCIVSHTD
ncbi:MAG: hypothetical protein NVS4B8_23870 [Herpetosiphon sp.]